MLRPCLTHYCANNAVHCLHSSPYYWPEEGGCRIKSCDIRHTLVLHMCRELRMHQATMHDASKAAMPGFQQCCQLHAGVSDDERGHFRGSDVGRSDSGEVEMTEFDRPGMPRNTSASMLDEPAGTRAGVCPSH